MNSSSCKAFRLSINNQVPRTKNSTSRTAGKQIEPTTDIRILRLNLEKTHRVSGSFTGYRAYFELSETPSSAWSEIFGREWNDLDSAGKASIDGGFLVIQCPLQKILFNLPLMRMAITLTNEEYRRHSQEQKGERNPRVEVSKEEVSIFEEIARFLKLR